MCPPSPVPATPSVRERLITTASHLFYTEGIHAVGIDRVLAEAGVAKASLYHHFSGKDDLVVAYLAARSDAIVQGLRDRLAGAEGDAVRRIGIVFDGIWSAADDEDFRGCPFINAAAEYPRPEHPVRRQVAAHRQRFQAVIAEQIELGGGSASSALVEALAVAYDGCMIAAAVDGVAAARRAGEFVVDGLLG